MTAAEALELTREAEAAADRRAVAEAPAKLAVALEIIALEARRGNRHAYVGYFHDSLRTLTALGYCVEGATTGLRVAW